MRKDNTSFINLQLSINVLETNMLHQESEHTIKKLFDEQFHELVFVSFRIVKDYGQAEDIVQDVFVKIWQNFDTVKHIPNLKPYTTIAVKNSSLNYLRNAKVREKWLKETHDSGHDAEHYANDEAPTDFDSNKIHEAVDRIPEKWRQAFILSKYENLKYNEIAKRLAVSEKTVEKYISKALKFLRIELKDVQNILLFLLFFRKL